MVLSLLNLLATVSGLRWSHKCPKLGVGSNQWAVTIRDIVGVSTVDQLATYYT